MRFSALWKAIVAAVPAADNVHSHRGCSLHRDYVAVACNVWDSPPVAQGEHITAPRRLNGAAHAGFPSTPRVVLAQAISVLPTSK